MHIRPLSLYLLLPHKLRRPLRPLPNKITARYSYLYSRILPLSPFSLIWQIESLPKVTVARERSPEIEPFLMNVNYIWHIEEFIYFQTHLPSILSYFHFNSMVVIELFNFLSSWNSFFQGVTCLCVQYIIVSCTLHTERDKKTETDWGIFTLYYYSVYSIL
jgi:hypothetical protein